ncbi:MAG: putative integral rane protein [Bryobacterales bacterium]|jgi:DNA-binding winged helix-turn-helix (wHTH) protein/tetratricopeptide (TPR) repeat protein|nr:putative integral rane protein [Bryobacterales bacterium]
MVRIPVEPIPFGPFCLDAARSRLLRDGVEIDVRPQAFHVLHVLVQNSGRHVNYEQMIQAAWSGTLVSKHTVAVTVGEVKKVLGECGPWISYRPRLGYCLETPHADDLVRQGWHCWNRCTREGFERALCYFQRAARESNDPRAFEGASLSYLMMGTYGMRPARQMYQGFLQAHRRAVALSGLTPDLRADRAQGLHVFEHKIAEAEADLLQALREKPKWVPVHIRLSMLYAATGRLDEALEQVEEVRAIDPLAVPLPTSEVFVRFFRGELDAALIAARDALELHPYLPLGRALYAQALEYSGDTEEALKQYRMATVLCPDLPWLRALEAICLANSGRRAEAVAILQQLEELRDTEYVDAYFQSLLLHALGRKDEAFLELERAANENSAALFVLDVDPRMDPLRADARLGPIRNRVFGPEVGDCLQFRITNS